MKNYVHGLGAVLLAGFVSSSCMAQEPTAPLQETPKTQKSVTPLVFASPAAKTAWKFSFGDKALPSTLLVAPETVYTSALGYGFESGNEIVTKSGFTTSDKPFTFSAAVPAGNYKVTVMLGDTNGESNTTVKA